MVDKEDLPSYCDALNIQKGMLYSDVTKLIGLPQTMRTFGLMVVEYKLADGNKLVVEYVRNSDGSLEVEKVQIENVMGD